MHKRAIVAAAFVAAVCAVQAQSANPFVGTWDVTYTHVPRGSPIPREEQGTLVITETGGTWRVYARSTIGDPCSGRDTPIEIRRVDERQLRATVKYSSLADTCKDGGLELNRDEQGRVTGRRGQFELTLKKK